MAELSITISNVLDVKPQVVGDQVSLWGAMVWGTDYWWGNYDTTFDIVKFLANDSTVSGAIDKRADKFFGNDVALTQTIAKTAQFGITIKANNFVNVNTAANRVVTQGPWTRDEPDLVDWTEVDEGDTIWTQSNGSSTPWSDS